MQAVILCGGRGTRLSTLYPDHPKALVPVAGRPVIEWQINWLSSNHIGSIILAAGYMGDKIRGWIERQSFQGRVKVAIEPAPLGTGGALKYASQLLAQTRFLVLNGDSLVPGLNFQNMETAHRESDASATIAVTSIEDAARYGTVSLDSCGKIINFNEKGRSGAGWVNAGIYLLEPSILSAISPDKNVSIENEIFPNLAAEGKLSAFQAKPPLLDMGTPEGLQAMEQYLRQTVN